MAIFNSYVKLPEGRLDCMGNGDLNGKSKRQSPTKEEKRSNAAKAKQKHKPWYPLVNIQKAIENCHL